MAQASREAWEDFDQDCYYDEILGTRDPDGTRLPRPETEEADTQ